MSNKQYAMSTITQERLEKLEKVASQRQKGLILVLEDIHFPSNAQAMFRSAEAFGVLDVFLIFEKEKVFNPAKAEKEVSSSGYKWLNFHYFDTSRACFEQLKKDGYSIVVTALNDGAENLYTANIFEEKIALVMGNEPHGVSEVAMEMADRVLMMPMLGLVQSLNVSVSCGIFLYEITRQRYPELLKYRLSTIEQEALVKDFASR